MRVLHLVGYAPMGGIENYTRNLFSELEKSGHQNVIFASGARLNGLETPQRTVIQTPEIGDASGANLDHRLSRVEQLLDQHGCDVVFIHTGLHRRIAAAITNRLPTVWFAHNYGSFCPAGALFYARTQTVCEIENTPNWHCLVNAYAKHCNTRHPARLAAIYRNGRHNHSWIGDTNGLVCDSEYVAQRHARAGYSREMIAVLPSPVLLPAAGQLRSTDPESQTLLFAGRLVTHKGLHVLLTALGAVKSPWRLQVAGEGHDADRLKRLCGELGLNPRVEFLGRVSRTRMEELYRDSAVVVAPSVWPEPFGMVGPEALSWGRPVVASAIAGINEWLIDEETGLAVEPGNAVQLAAKIDRLLADPGLRSRLGDAGRELVRRRFTFAAHVEKLIEVFERAIANHQAGVRLGG